MEKSLKFRSNALIYGIPISIFSLALFLTFNGYLAQNTQLLMMLSIDLLITAPFLYFLAIRKTNIPKFTIFSVFLIGVLITTYVLPKEALPELKYVGLIILPLLELIVLAVVIISFLKLRKGLQSSNGNDELITLRKVIEGTLGNNIYAKLLTTEISFVYYALFSWKKKIPTINQFTYHIKNGMGSIFGIVVLVLLVEAFAMHILLEKWNETFAWVLTIASLYATLQIFAHLKAAQKRFTTLGNDTLNLKYGLFGDVSIKYENIDSIELTKRIPKEKNGVINLALLDSIELHNVVLRLKENVVVQKAYGMKKNGNIILFHIDEKDNFFEAINAKL